MSLRRTVIALVQSLLFGWALLYLATYFGRNPVRDADGAVTLARPI